MVDAPLQPAVFEDEAADRRRSVLGYSLILAAVALWSVNSAAAKVVIESGGLSALRLAEMRAAGSAFLLLVAVALVRPRLLRIGLRELGYLAVFGIAGLAFVHFFYFAAISRLDIGVALVIQYIAPVLVAVWARFFVHEPVRRRLWFALALSLLGLSFVVQLWSGVTLDGIGVLASLAGALSYAIYILMADGSIRRGRDAYSLLAWGFLFAALFWSVAQPWWSFPGEVLTSKVSLLGRLDSIEAPVWVLIGYVVVFGTIVPFILMVSALRYIPPTRATVVAMVEPVLAALVAFLWLDEELTSGQIGGGILVLAAVLVAQSARTRAGNRRTSSPGVEKSRDSPSDPQRGGSGGDPRLGHSGPS